MDTIIEHTTASAILQSALQEKSALPVADASLEKARAVLSKFGIPEVKNERYKYANVSRFINEGGFTFASSETEFSESFLENISAPASSNTLVTLNGKVVRFDSNEVFSLSSISDYLSAHPEVTFDETDSMQALSLLTAKQGFYLNIKSSSTEPLVWFNIISADAPAYNATLNAITIAAQTEAEILEIRIGKNQAVFANQFTQVYTRSKANLRISVSDNYLGESSGIFSTVAFQEKESTFSHSILATGGKFVRQNLTAEHGGENCHTEMNGFYTSDGNRHQDFSTTVKHMFPNCTSDELYKGVAADQSKAIFNGKVYVARDAQKTNAYQSNKNILLSDEALIRSKPELEIYADDVKCSHGSTTGQTDTKSLFYLRSRGIREKEAQKMLMLAFAGDVLERISNEEIRNYLSEIAGDKLQVIL
jgi:Fe-S cluster assembly protein SufD